MPRDCDDSTVWIGTSTPEVKIGLSHDCWTSYVVYPHGQRGCDALRRSFTPHDLTVVYVDKHGVAYNAAGESIGLTGTQGPSCLVGTQ